MKTCASFQLSAVFAAGLCSLFGPVQAQVITDVFDGAGDETYTGVNGFGPFNWVNAVNFGFPSQHGGNAFLSNYTGTPLADIGMIKPFPATMSATTYRVAFYCGRYSSPNTLSIGSYDTLYIGSRHGTMVWDTVPTPVNDYEWVRWSGLYTPAPQDIGQPFHFGFSITLWSGTSFALDGPVTATDLATGFTERLDGAADLAVRMDGSGTMLQVSSSLPLRTIELYDARGALIAQESGQAGTTMSLNVSAIPSGVYVVRAGLVDGTWRSVRLAR